MIKARACRHQATHLGIPVGVGGKNRKEGRITGACRPCVQVASSEPYMGSDAVLNLANTMASRDRSVETGSRFFAPVTM